MATNGKIGRLYQRIDTLASRRSGILRIEDITDEARDRLERRLHELRGGGPPNMRAPTALENWSDDALIRALIKIGTLTEADFKRPETRQGVR
jgi:hypothetical protein